jgi:hypothetical protein
MLLRQRTSSIRRHHERPKFDHRGVCLSALQYFTPRGS